MAISIFSDNIDNASKACSKFSIYIIIFKTALFIGSIYSLILYDYIIGDGAMVMTAGNNELYQRLLTLSFCVLPCILKVAAGYLLIDSGVDKKTDIVRNKEPFDNKTDLDEDVSYLNS